jgi:hypothetical protein
MEPQDLVLLLGNINVSGGINFSQSQWTWSFYSQHKMKSTIEVSVKSVTAITRFTLEKNAYIS